MIKYKISSIGCLSICCVSSLTAFAQQQPKPNVVFILADDLGYGDVGCYGQQIIKTPNIDLLANSGMLMTNHYAGCTVSSPSRSVLLTGLHTGHTFIRGNKEVEPEGQYALPTGTFTIAKMLHQAGYTTGAFGKWGLGAPKSSGDPNNLGFDDFYGYNCQKLAHNSYPYHLWFNQTKVMLPGNEGLKKEQYAPDLIQQQAIKFLQRNHKGKFFMYLAYTLPHAELTSPNDSIYKFYSSHLKEVSTYRGVDQQGKDYKTGGYGSSLTPRADFASMVTRLDAYVGELMSEVKRLGIEKNTLIIFTSDNGPHREGGADPDFFKSYGQFRGVKRDMYEGGIRVPMIAVWPNVIKAGSSSNHISAFWDIMPTFKDLAGIKLPVKSDGISMLPTLLSKKNQKNHQYLYWEFHEQGGKIAVRMGQWKGIKLNYGKNPAAKMLLYNLSKDIHEDYNVADSYPKVVARLEQIIHKARTESQVFKFGKE
ncbi:MAG: arylsulfatase [Porphyromonadaceae bacterium CG2_30_38_12]|nr:MAG: arylsulfatase [Porphyromonadaceae bacterium CG2_30_38_12]